jgi:hypothetical protein
MKQKIEIASMNSVAVLQTWYAIRRPSDINPFGLLCFERVALAVSKSVHVH